MTVSTKQSPELGKYIALWKRREKVQADHKNLWSAEEDAILQQMDAAWDALSEEDMYEFEATLLSISEK